MSSASTVSLRNRLDVLTVENKQLKQRLEAAERDNRALKLSVYDLSARLNTALVRAGSHHSGLPPAPPNGEAPKGGKSDAAAAAINRSVDDSRLGVGGVRADLDELIEPPSSSSSAPTARFDSRHFEESCTLRGHGGAVYTVAFSPNGRLLASGSFDRSVRCWAVEGVQPTETLCLDKHTHHVSSLSWSADSRSVLSGSFDHTIRWWDLDKGVSERLWHVPSSAFVQAVAHHPNMPSAFAVATTSNSVLLFDARVAADKPTAELANGTMVNSMLFLPRGEHVLTGDRHGALRTWDLRHQRRCVTCAYAGDARKPVSHVTLSRALPVSSAWVAAASLPSASGVNAGSSTAEWGSSTAAGLDSTNGALDRLLAVNSYDDTLRIFDSGFAPPHAFLRRPSSRSSTGLGAGAMAGALAGAKEGGGAQHGAQGGPLLAEAEAGVVLGATANGADADGDAYLYDVSGPKGTGSLLQRLRGHTDRVYAVDFHNELPLLASGSADFTIKLWAPQQQARRDERANRRRMGDS
ncbi:wd40 repeat-containing protein [Chrysochromulina tobinii]|uniref:Wd40 repeat-containing protein n=1 Tax=Chrysochromulina tobinii TaxID=1460289 RepID=A0A0M0JEV6_9EUKA|nr:wd40 repeat-containing protein [Chrysochromulina tobinii]|eukprot:KOO24902.1 wd40 repeat-containing protein [Chrysochromulina sp. CCMP291]